MFLGETLSITTIASIPGVFLMAYILGQLVKIADMEDEFGLVPFPAKDSSSNYRVETNLNYFSLMIPSNLDNSKTKDAGAFLQAYCYAAQDVKKARFDECANRYLCDKQSRNNLGIIENNQRNEFENKIKLLFSYLKLAF